MAKLEDIKKITDKIPGTMPVELSEGSFTLGSNVDLKMTNVEAMDRKLNDLKFCVGNKKGSVFGFCAGTNTIIVEPKYAEDLVANNRFKGEIFDLTQGRNFGYLIEGTDPYKKYEKMRKTDHSPEQEQMVGEAVRQIAEHRNWAVEAYKTNPHAAEGIAGDFTTKLSKSLKTSPPLEYSGLVEVATEAYKAIKLVAQGTGIKTTDVVNHIINDVARARAEKLGIEPKDAAVDLVNAFNQARDTYKAGAGVR